MNALHFLNDSFQSNKKVLVRVDFNVTVDARGAIIDTSRIVNHLPTLKFLLSKQSEIVLIAHLGQPEGKYIANLSFAKLLPQLEKVLGLKLRLQQLDLYKSDPQAITLLENIRFFPSEALNDRNFAQRLADLADIYINDAFSVAHREQASTVGVTQLLPSYAGLALQNELANLTPLLTETKKPYTLVVGGKKVSDKIGVLEHLLPLVDNVLIGGACANTFAKAEGIDIRSSYYEESMLQVSKQLMNQQYSNKIMLPCDYNEHEDAFVDIGTETVKQFSNIISRSKTIVWAGPLGKYESPEFNKGNIAILKAIATSGAKSVIGGGDTIAALQGNEDLEKISFISLGGGAMLEFLAKGELVGVEALKW